MPTYRESVAKFLGEKSGKEVEKQMMELQVGDKVFLKQSPSVPPNYIGREVILLEKFDGDGYPPRWHVKVYDKLNGHHSLVVPEKDLREGKV